MVKYICISKRHSLLLLQTVEIDKSQLHLEVSKACLTGFYTLYLPPCVPKNWILEYIYIYKVTVLQHFFTEEKAIPELEMQ